MIHDLLRSIPELFNVKACHSHCKAADSIPMTIQAVDGIGWAAKIFLYE